MVFIFLIILLHCTGSWTNSHVISISSPTHSDKLIKCVTDIIMEYFAPKKVLTHVGNTQGDGEFLKAIEKLNAVAITSKSYEQKLINKRHEAYFMCASNYTVFVEYFPHLIRESSWNPEARFLIIIISLDDSQLKYIFDRLLKQHVRNVIVVNGTADAHLYTYNPFDNYACGRRYDDIIKYGKCSEAQTLNLFPDKYVTGLQNCTFNVSVPHWPPYSIIPSNNTDTSFPLSYGIEPYCLQLVSEMCGFKINIVLDHVDSESFSSITSDMEAVGALKILQNSEADVVLGGLILLPTRTRAFNYLYDFLPFVDEVRFAVKRAEIVSDWKKFYLEFDGTVWILIVLSIIFYSTLMISLLRVEDKSSVVLKLLDNLVLHGCKIQCKPIVKYIFIIWVWFSYLINSFYQSSLVSLTTNPPSEKQISTEAEIYSHNLKACVSDLMLNYSTETTLSFDSHKIPGCKTLTESLNTVTKFKDYYTIVLHEMYKYNIQNHLDDYGYPYIYPLKEPYCKIIYSMYFYNGFPLIQELRLSALRIREMGLVDKAISDINYIKIIQLNFLTKEYGSRFVFPWHILTFGCAVAAITFIIEIISVRKN